MKPIYYAITDTWMMAWRNLIHYTRLPQLLFFSSVQPIIFLLLFNYVFGGAIGGATHVPGGKYINYLLPGILVQTTLFGAIQTGVGLATDMGQGIVDRFRSLPMSRGAVMAGRTFSDVIRNLSVAIIMLTVGTLLGFRFQHGVINAVLMVGLVLLFSFAISWIFAFVGLGAKEPETAQLAGFVSIFPMVFASAAFVPIATMPGWLQAFARNQPITFAVQSARYLAVGTPANGAIWKLILWIVGLLVVFIPLAVWRYKRNV